MRLHTTSLLAACLLSSPAVAQPKIREPIEWSQTYIQSTRSHDKPRVLFVGDSITGAYFTALQTRLADAAYLSEYVTSMSIADPDYIKQLALVLREGAVDIVHINNGMHGVGYSEAQYTRGYRAVLDYLAEHLPQATVIVTTTTPRRFERTATLDDYNPRIIARNSAVVKLARSRTLLVDDLYSLVVDHPEYGIGDGTHYNADGVTAEANEVESLIRSLVPLK